MSFRTLEVLRGLGVGDEVHAVADGVSSMVLKPTLKSTEQRQAVDIDAIFSGMAELSPEPAAQYCPQSKLEPILLDYARAHRSEVRYETELVSFQHDDSGVTAVVRDPDSQEVDTVYADYLVAADGVHSPVREALGVPTAGYGALPIMWCSSTSAPRGARLSPTSATETRWRSKTPRYKGYSCPSPATVACSSPPIIPPRGKRSNSSPRSAVEG